MGDPINGIRSKKIRFLILETFALMPWTTSNLEVRAIDGVVFIYYRLFFLKFKCARIFGSSVKYRPLLIDLFTLREMLYDATRRQIIRNPRYQRVFFL